MPQHYQPGSKSGAQQGPDPAIEEAINHLTRTELSPLEEVMFNSWASANQLDDHDKPENNFDYRKLYQETGGKVFAPGELKNHTAKLGAIQTLMQAQQAHDSSSPIKQLMAAHEAQNATMPQDFPK